MVVFKVGLILKVEESLPRTGPPLKPPFFVLPFHVLSIRRDPAHIGRAQQVKFRMSQKVATWLSGVRLLGGLAEACLQQKAVVAVPVENCLAGEALTV